MPEPDKDFFRKYLTKRQFFALLNVILVASLILTGGLEFTAKSIICNGLVLAWFNIAAHIGAKRDYPHWK